MNPAGGATAESVQARYSIGAARWHGGRPRLVATPAVTVDEQRYLDGVFIRHPERRD